MRGTFETFGAVGLIFCFTLIASAQQRPSDAGQLTAAEALARYEQLLQTTPDQPRKFYLTTKAASTALAAAEPEKAKTYALALLEQADTLRNDWNYGNAIHVANLVLGQIALTSGDITEARRLLLEAGRTPGSPQLNSFGPNMLLAKGLLAKGEREAVVQYFDLCATFWKDRQGRLPAWKAAVQKGEEPQFGPNLSYLLETWRFEQWDKL
jgi:hypothetical protein